MNTKAEHRVGERALEGVKVIALVHGITGPLTASILASYGAEVVRIESRTRIGWDRQGAPFIGNVKSPDRSIGYLSTNSGQLGLTLNLKHPRANEVMARLIRWADVMVDNFAGGVTAKMGLGYEDVKKIKPDIIVLSSPIYGGTGPLAGVRGYGSTLTALTGLPHITGFPDQIPQLPGLALTDFVAPRANVLAIVAALDYRRRTGKGQFIDAGQMESAVPLLTSVLLDYQVNGREARRIGNRSTYAAPDGVYRCKGNDRWCVITVFDEDWNNFCKAIGKPAWTEDSEFSTLAGRLENADRLDIRVGEWTVNRAPEEVMSLMQSAGVAAGVVQGALDLSKDPQQEHRHFYWRLERPGMGSFTYNGMPVKLSKTPYEIGHAPLLEEHNEYVLIQCLGIPDQEFVQLMAEGVLE